MGEKALEDTHEKEYGLIGNLYHSVIGRNSFKSLKDLYDPTRENGVDYFQFYWLGIKIPNSKYWGSLAKHDVFEASYREDIISWINSSECEENIQLDLDRLKIDKITVLTNLIDSLTQTTTFHKSRKNSNEYSYNEAAKKRLIAYINTAKELGDKKLIELHLVIKWYIYYAVFNSVPMDFSENTRTKKDLDEFVECVIKRYGSTTKHGIREIIRLADREEPNKTALYEYADLLYFGNAEGIKQDVNAAFKKYKEAAGINSASEQISKLSDANPLALWSLSYIYYNYKNPTLEKSLADKNVIYELEALEFRDRIWRSIKRAKEAYSIAQLPCVLNTLGLLARLIDEDLEDQELHDLRKEFDLENCTYYFERAAEDGFLYAYNNLAEEERRAFVREKGNPKEQEKHLANYLEYLDKSAKKHEPWAANKLGRIYLEGIKVLDPKANKSRYKSLLNRELAFFYFFKAYEAYHVFYDENCAWACGHLIREFLCDLTDGQIDDMYDIIDSYSYDKEIVKNAFKQEDMPSKDQVIGIWKKFYEK